MFDILNPRPSEEEVKDFLKQQAEEHDKKSEMLTEAYGLIRYLEGGIDELEDSVEYYDEWLENIAEHTDVDVGKYDPACIDDFRDEVGQDEEQTDDRNAVGEGDE